MTTNQQASTVSTGGLKDKDGRKNVFFRIALGCLSFIVGLSAFLIIKLLFQPPLYLMITQGHLHTVQTLQLPLLILCIFLAYLCTKKINKIASAKTRYITSVAVIVIGFISMVAFPLLGLAMQ